jgi:polyhydroxyalkanoate synthesis regulator phasin
MKKTTQTDGSTNMDTIRKAMLLGLGAISLTKEKAEEIIDDLVSRGEVSRKDQNEMVDRLLKEAEAQKDELERKVATTVQKAMDDLGLPTQKDFKGIVRRLEEIEKALVAMKKGDGGITT